LTDGIPENRIRAALYARVSSDRQEQEETVRSQLEALRNYAKEKGYLVVEEFVDEGYSGATLRRPALDRLRDAVHEGAFDKVVLLTPDRLARKLAYQLLLLEEFEKAGVQLEFLQGQWEDSAEGTLMLHIQGAVAEYERAKIAERTVRGKNYWAQQGALMGGYTPYGYRYVPREGERRATLVPDDQTAPVVREIFRLLVEERLSCRAIAKTLTERGIPTPAGTGHWRESTVNRILRQRAYVGTFLYRRTMYEKADGEHRPTRSRLRPPEEWIEVPVPALVSLDLFARAQQQLKENSRFSPRNLKRHEYLLRGLVRCGRCGGAMVGRASHGVRYYGCVNFDPHNVGAARLCRPSPSVRADWLEAEVWAVLSERIRNPDLLLAEFRARLQEPHADAVGLRMNALRAELAKLDRQKTRLLDLYQVEQMDLPELKQRLANLDTERARLQSELSSLAERASEQAQLRDVETAFREFAKKIAVGLDTMDFAQRQQVARLLIKAVIVDKDTGEVRIETLIPTPKAERGRETFSRPRDRLRSAGRHAGIQGHGLGRGLRLRLAD